MTSTTAKVILAIAKHEDSLTAPDRNAILAALLPTSWVNLAGVHGNYFDVVTALYNRDRYDEEGVGFAAIMLAAGSILGDADAYQVSEDGSIGLDPALAVDPEREAWDARAREIAERMAEAETVVAE
jgi:hypothetical protein